MKMKHFILPFACLIMFNAFGQRETDNTKGIRAGWHNADMFTDGEGSGTLNSFYVGFFNERKIAPLFHFGSGLEYFQNGTADDNSSLRLHTISVPLYLQANIAMFFVNGGAALNFKVADKLKIGDESIDVPDELKTKFFDLPLHLGVGVEFLMLRLEARYHWGLLNVSSFENGPDVKNQYFQLGLGVAF